jgi:hypothetical protein
VERMARQSARSQLHGPPANGAMKVQTVWQRPFSSWLRMATSALGLPTTVPALAPTRSSGRVLRFALPEDHAASAR